MSDELEWKNGEFRRMDFEPLGRDASKEPSTQTTSESPLPKRKPVDKWTDADTRPVPVKVFRLDETLEIDFAIKKRMKGRRPTVRANIQVNAIWFGRRCLATAIRTAVMWPRQNRRRKEWESDWQNLIEDANRAAKALDAMLNALHPLVWNADLQRLMPPRPRWYSINLQHLQTRPGQSGSQDIAAAHTQANRDIAAILRARKVARRLAHEAESRRKAFTSSLQNPGAPETREFIRVLAEGWVFLMGRRPGTGSNNNPFIDFAQAAWSDWKGEDQELPDFMSALRAASKGLSPSDVEKIISDGPCWEKDMNPRRHLI